MTYVSGAVLAAGHGLRMGAPKAELVVAGERLVDRAAAALTAAGCDDVIAVVRRGVEVPTARSIENPHPEDGLRSSLGLAVDAVDAESDVLVVILADMPGLAADAIRTVVDGWAPGRIALGRVETSSGHPIAMAPENWRAALALAEPDEGARAYLRTHPDLVDHVPITADLTDLDTPEDLAEWRRSHP